MKSLDIRPIVNNFYRDILDDEDRSNWEAYILLVLPLILAQAAIFRHIDAAFMSTMSTSLAILFGFTFNSLMITARYSSKDDRLEELVVRETRLSTAYALLVNLIALLLVVSTSIVIVDYSEVSYMSATVISAGVYFVLFHYLFVMVHLLRYVYLLAIGGAFEEGEDESSNEAQSEEAEISLN